MTAQFVIIIVGIVLTLLAITDFALKSNSGKGIINSKIAVLFAVSGICLSIYGGFSYSAINPQPKIEQPAIESKKQVDYPIDKVQIISPVENEAVKCRILTMGVYPDSLQKKIWVLLKPSDKKYYPQSDHTNPSFKRKNEWQVITRFGGDKGEKFDVIAYEADSVASEFFSTTIQKWKDNLSYPGLTAEELPDGIKEVDRIQVSLEESCRGVF